MDFRLLLVSLFLMVAALGLELQVTANGIDPTQSRLEVVSGQSLEIAGSLSNNANSNVSITGYRISTNPASLKTIFEQATGQSLGATFDTPLTIPAGQSIPLTQTLQIPEMPLPAGNYDITITIDTSAGSQSWTFMISVPSKGIIDSIVGAIIGFILWILSFFTGG